jgi:hypothetical protein
MTRLPAAAQTIVGRHRADAAEFDRTCRACGRPWPCDVRLLGDILAPAHALADVVARPATSIPVVHDRIPAARAPRRFTRRPTPAAS